MMQKKKWLLVGIAALLVVALCMGLFLLGVIRINTPSVVDYPVRGVDVSEYQGAIDWTVIERQNIQFAFIRATEGSGYVDATFAANWDAVAGTDILAGAYHFFSFDSGADTQAANFMAAVPVDRPMLPPVVDVELYGKHRQNPPEAEVVRQELSEMLRLLEDYYGVKPILYATQKAYILYLADHFEGHPIWIRDVFFTPHLPDEREWAFWQYSDKGQLDGYAGEEKYIDLNVYAGSPDEIGRLVTASHKGEKDNLILPNNIAG